MYCDTVVGVRYRTKYKLVPSLFSRLTIIEGITFRTESNCEEVKWERNEDARTSRKINNNEVSNFSYPKRINLKIKKLVWDDIAGGRRPPAIEGKSNSNILRVVAGMDIRFNICWTLSIKTIQNLEHPFIFLHMGLLSSSSYFLRCSQALRRRIKMNDLTNSVEFSSKTKTWRRVPDTYNQLPREVKCDVLILCKISNSKL